MTYEAFDGYIEHEMPILDMFLGAAFSHFAGWLWKEYRRHSKIYELQADRQSADRVGLETEARAQLLLEGSTRTAQNLIFDPLEKRYSAL